MERWFKNVGSCMTVYREFRLDGSSSWPPVVAFIRQHAADCISRNSPLRLIVTEEEKRRTNEQNRFFHGPILDAICSQAWWGGKTYSKEFWKEYFRRRYLLKDEIPTPDGEVIQLYWSTADLSSKQFTEFLDRVMSEAAAEWGVEFDAFA